MGTGTHLWVPAWECHGAHMQVRGKPKYQSLSSALFEIGSLVHWCLCQAGWPVSFWGFCLCLLSHRQSSGITDAFSCIQFSMSLGESSSLLLTEPASFPVSWPGRILAFRLPRIYTANIEGGARLDHQLTTYRVWRILVTDIVGIFWDWVVGPTWPGISQKALSETWRSWLKFGLAVTSLYPFLCLFSVAIIWFKADNFK